MNQSLRRFVCVGLTGAAALVGSSCTERDGGASTELREAGYTLTQEDWFKASAADDVEAMKQFAAANFALDAVNPAGDTALHVAAGAGAEKAADFLLRRGLAIDLRGANERTPLMGAVVDDRPAMVGWLLRQGADPRLQDADGFRPLLLAVRVGSTGSIVELAPYTREDLDNALLLAAMTGNAAAIDELTNYGASVYASMPDGRTPLMMAAESGHREAVNLLLDIGASRFATDAQGFSAADYARQGGHEELVGVILREPTRDEMVFQTPEEIATRMGSFEDVADAGFTPLPEDVADAATGERYIAAPGQRFFGADGTEFTIKDVRPSQLVVEDAGGSVHTLPLRGPRG